MGSKKSQETQSPVENVKDLSLPMDEWIHSAEESNESFERITEPPSDLLLTTRKVIANVAQEEVDMYAPMDSASIEAVFVEPVESEKSTYGQETGPDSEPVTASPAVPSFAAEPQPELSLAASRPRWRIPALVFSFCLFGAIGLGMAALFLFTPMNTREATAGQMIDVAMAADPGELNEPNSVDPVKLSWSSVEPSAQIAFVDEQWQDVGVSESKRLPVVAVMPIQFAKGKIPNSSVPVGTSRVYGDISFSELSKDTFSQMALKILSDGGRFKTVSLMAATNGIKEIRSKSYCDCSDDDCKIAIARDLGIDMSLSTSVKKVGSRCLVAMKLVNLKSLTTEKAAFARGDCSDEGILRSLLVSVGRVNEIDVAATSPERINPPVSPVSTIFSH